MRQASSFRHSTEALRLRQTSEGIEAKDDEGEAPCDEVNASNAQQLCESSVPEAFTFEDAKLQIQVLSRSDQALTLSLGLSDFKTGSAKLARLFQAMFLVCLGPAISSLRHTPPKRRAFGCGARCCRTSRSMYGSRFELKGICSVGRALIATSHRCERRL